MHVLTFQHWIHSINFIPISNFVSNLFYYIWNYHQYQWTNNDIPPYHTVQTAFLVSKWITCLSLTSLLNVSFDPLQKKGSRHRISFLFFFILTWSHNRGLASIDSVESANKPVFDYMQRTIIYWILTKLKRVKIYLLRNQFVWEWMILLTLYIDLIQYILSAYLFCVKLDSSPFKIFSIWMN